MMDWQEPHERNDRDTAADLGLTPMPDPDAAPEWFMAPEPEPRYLCDADAWEWQYHAGLSADAMEERARELATHIVLRMEIENHELRERNAAQAQELARLRELRAEAADHLVAQVNEAQAETDAWTEKYYHLDRSYKRVQQELADLTVEKRDLIDGTELMRSMFRDYGFVSGSLPERLEAMHREFTVLRQHVDAQSGAHFRPVPPDAAA